MNFRKAHIQSLVKDLIKKQGIVASTAVDVHQIASDLGIKIVEEPAADTLSGFLFRDSANAASLIVVNKSHAPNRKRFTVAHEIGHFLLHNYEGFHFDGLDSGFQLRFRDERSQDGTDLDEREANQFAAELLMPEDFIREEIRNLGPIDLLGDEKKLKILAKKFQVSSQALIYRLTNLGYIA